MFGNCATGKLTIVMAPTITVRMAITIATMGRLIKKLDISSASFQLISALCVIPIWQQGEGLGRFSQPTQLLASVSRAIVIQLDTNGLGCTIMPGRKACWPSATTRSPAFSPSSMIHMVPIRSPTLTGRIEILPSGPTTSA